MTMDLLKRELAPILPEAWARIDAEAARVLRAQLAARKVVDFKGPFGWKFAAVNTGRLTVLSPLLAEEPVPGVSFGLRVVQPLVELRTPVVLNLGELDSAARGGDNPDLAAVIDAAKRMAHAEDSAIFLGHAPAGIQGMIPMSPHQPIVAGDAAQLPRSLVEAIETLRGSGVGGPYALALGTRLYEEVTAATEEGYPILNRVERLLVDGRIVHAPALDGGVLLSIRGGDYELTVGQDLSMGYAYHSREEVELYLTESFTFRVLEPTAAIHLRAE